MFTTIKYLRQLMWKSQLLSTVAKLEKTPQFCTWLSWNEPPRQLVLLWFAGLAIFANWCYHGDIISGCLLGGAKSDSHLSIYRSISEIGVDMCVCASSFQMINNTAQRLHNKDRSTDEVHDTPNICNIFWNPDDSILPFMMIDLVHAGHPGHTTQSGNPLQPQIMKTHSFQIW